MFEKRCVPSDHRIDDITIKKRRLLVGLGAPVLVPSESHRNRLAFMSAGRAIWERPIRAFGLDTSVFSKLAS